MKENTLIIVGHPLKQSFCGALGESYYKGAQKSNSNVELIYLADCKFNPILTAYKDNQEMEADLKKVQDKISACSHLVLVFPIWWSTYPALFKGFMDRVFLPGYAFKYKASGFPEKYMKGRSGRLIITCGGPAWYQKFILKSPAVKSLKNGLLNFCGFSPVKVTRIGSLSKSTDIYRKKALNRIFNLACKNK